MDITILLLQNKDTCFTKHPDPTATDIGVSSVGHELQTGVECTFSAIYRIHHHTDCIQVNCSIKSRLSSYICVPAKFDSVTYIYV